MRLRHSTFPRAGLALVLAACLASARADAAPPVHVSLPTIAAPPGATVVVPIDVDQDLSPYAITSINYSLALDPVKIQSATFNTNNGLITNWGPPFTNTSSTSAAALGVGFAPIVSTLTRVEIVYLTIAPSVALGTDIPLAFQRFVLNDGSPSVTLGTGLIQVRGTVDVGIAGSRVLALGNAEPNPVRDATRLALWIPDDGRIARARVEVLDLGGRRVRALADDAFTPGRHELRWDARDASGAPVATGLYWIRLERGGVVQQRRVVVLR